MRSSADLNRCRSTDGPISTVELQVRHAGPRGISAHGSRGTGADVQLYPVLPEQLAADAVAVGLEEIAPVIEIRDGQNVHVGRVRAAIVVKTDSADSLVRNPRPAGCLSSSAMACRLNAAISTPASSVSFFNGPVLRLRFRPADPAGRHRPAGRAPCAQCSVKLGLDERQVCAHGAHTPCRQSAAY